MISDTNALRTLVKEYLSSTIGSGMLLGLNFVRTKQRHFVTVSSLDDNELFMTKCRYLTEKKYFKSRYEGEQQQRCDYEVAAIRITCFFTDSPIVYKSYCQDLFLTIRIDFI